jgi:hypothetical protein
MSTNATPVTAARHSRGRPTGVIGTRTLVVAQSLRRLHASGWTDPPSLTADANCAAATDRVAAGDKSVLTSGFGWARRCPGRGSLQQV